MTCAMELRSTATLPPRRVVMALSLALVIATGECHVLRALTLPSAASGRPQQTLRQLAGALATHLARDLARRVPPPQANAEWTNASVALERSLQLVHNPQFPVSIALD